MDFRAVIGVPLVAIVFGLRHHTFIRLVEHYKTASADFFCRSPVKEGLDMWILVDHVR
jgi:hypothetical protein